MLNNRPQVAQLKAAAESLNRGRAQYRTPAPAPIPANRTGLPDRLKAGVEGCSGVALDDVRVHYNSSRPTQIQALAYTRGTEIHLGPGQDPHLPHEAWHVVQQKQGRVRPTMQMKGVPINGDEGLEREADVMGRASATATAGAGRIPAQALAGGRAVVQRVAWLAPGTRVDVTDESDILIGSATIDRVEGDTYRLRDGHSPGIPLQVHQNRVRPHLGNPPPASSSSASPASAPASSSSSASPASAPASSSSSASSSRQEGLQPAQQQQQQNQPDLYRQILASVVATSSGLAIPDVHVDAHVKAVGAKAKAAQFGARIEALRSKIEAFANERNPGLESNPFVCVVRFYVKDANAGKTHPGINSWAYFYKQNPAARPSVRDSKKLASEHNPPAPLSADERERRALEHMHYGHDDPRSHDDPRPSDVMEESPFVSGTNDAAALIGADSPFNRKRANVMILDAGVRDQISTKEGVSASPAKPAGAGRAHKKFQPLANIKEDAEDSSSESGSASSAQAGEIAAPEGASSAPSPSGATKKIATDVSDRIVLLTHGAGSQEAANQPVATATHVAFLLVSKKLTHVPSKGTPQNACCVLEREVVIYAPDIDLAQNVFLEVENTLPELTGRVAVSLAGADGAAGAAGAAGSSAQPAAASGPEKDTSAGTPVRRLKPSKK